ncbi:MULTISPECIES: hypothetical protein [unclassified Halomonas]|uniref:hypothetical protein n=1 Tax=unclassified Halomonas TaxID=2609666 RepID=UPI003CE7DEBD
MLVFVIFLMIFVGVTFALYQVYETHFNINFGNEKKLSSTDFSHLNELSDSAQTATLTSEWSGFDQAVTNILGPGFSRDIVREAFATEKESTYAIPLVRRKNRLALGSDRGDVSSGHVSVRHLPCLKTNLPKVDARGLLITLIIFNCFLVQLLGAMSIYTLGYAVSMPLLVWLNEPLIVMLVIYALIFMTYVIAKLDMYMHDLYQLGKLFSQKYNHENSLRGQYT